MIDVLQLPVGKPDIVAVCHGSVWHLSANQHKPFKNMERVARPGFPSSQVDDPFRGDARQSHPLAPLDDVLIVLTGIGVETQDPQDVG